eukprot:m.208776 g.208776  ORF g.208776 m.208776 type:complete len:190 (-) comp15043_c4_seq15:1792-2361(-)
MCYVCVCAVCVLCLVWMGTQKVKATVRYTIVFFLFVFFVFVHRRQAAFQSATQECLDALVSDPSPVCCLVDGLGEALACGVVPQSVERFVGQLGQVIDKTSQSCCVFSANTNGFSANEHDVWQSLAYKADIVLECQALATGSSRDVHGLLGIQRMTITNPQRTTQQRHYKVTKDGNINLFAVGTGKGLM